MKSDLHYMNIALKRAKKSAEMGEVPVGAVIVKKEADGSERIISYGQNNREKSKNALLHAEISAINKACKKLGGWLKNKAAIAGGIVLIAIGIKILLEHTVFA